MAGERVFPLLHRHAVFLRQPFRLIALGRGVKQIGGKGHVEHRPGQRRPARLQRLYKGLDALHQLAHASRATQRMNGFFPVHRVYKAAGSGRQSADGTVLPPFGGKSGRLALLRELLWRTLRPFPRRTIFRRLPRRGRSGGLQAHLLHQREEFQLCHERTGGRIDGRRDIVGEADVHGRIGADRAQPAAEIGVLFRLGQFLPLALLDVERVKVFIDGVEIVEPADELARALGADARDAWDVVRRVALDGLHVDELNRLHAVFLADFRLVIERDLRLPLLCGSQPHRDAAAHELKAVAVTGGDDAFRTLLAADARQRAEDIVRFEAVALHQAVSQQAQQLLEVRQLLGQLLRHALPLGFVAGIRLVAERGGFAVKRDGHSIRLRLRQQPLQHGEKTVDAVCIKAVFRGEKLDPVKRAVQDAVAVQYQKFHG